MPPTAAWKSTRLKMKTKNLALVLLGAVAAAGALFLVPAARVIAQGADNDPAQVWDAFGGNQQAQKYSTATQITPDNVKNLKRAWSVHTGDVSSGERTTTWGATPLFANNTVYTGTPWYRIVAVEPDTGKTKWTYATHGGEGPPENQGLKNRGVAYWAASNPQAGQACQKIV